MSDEIVNVTELKGRLRAFAVERDWEQFHSPKNIAAALSIEASELLEPFQWLTDEQSWKIKTEPSKLKAVAEELADVMLYAMRLADLLGVNVPEALDAKIEANGMKYPVEKAKGSARKYTEL